MVDIPPLFFSCLYRLILSFCINSYLTIETRKQAENRKPKTGIFCGYFVPFLYTRKTGILYLVFVLFVLVHCTLFAGHFAQWLRAVSASPVLPCQEAFCLFCVFFVVVLRVLPVLFCFLLVPGFCCSVLLFC